MLKCYKFWSIGHVLPPYYSLETKQWKCYKQNHYKPTYNLLGQGLSHWIQLWKFYLIRSNFTLGEPVSLVKASRLFTWERIVLLFRVGRCTTSCLLGGRARLWCLVSCFDSLVLFMTSLTLDLRLIPRVPQVHQFNDGELYLSHSSISVSPFPVHTC